MIDLHLHTTASDGQYSPREVMLRAKKMGATSVAVTDHDTTTGIQEARQTAEELGLEFFPGIEISAAEEAELHILGYGIASDAPSVQALCQNGSEERKKRTEKLLRFLQNKGIPITLEDVKRVNDGKTSGRPHFARTLVDLGVVSSVSEAFDQYLTTPEYYETVERKKPTAQTGIRAICQAGGVAVLAHPYLLHKSSEELEQLIQELIPYGLQGIEVYYSKHGAEERKFYLSLAKRYGLLVTCGSDFHGEAVKPEIEICRGIGNNLCFCDETMTENLRKAIKKQKASQNCT